MESNLDSCPAECLATPWACCDLSPRLCACYPLGVEHPYLLLCLVGTYSLLKTLLKYDLFCEGTGKCHVFYFQKILKIRPPPTTSGAYAVARAPIVSFPDGCRASCLFSHSTCSSALSETSVSSLHFLGQSPLRASHRVQSKSLGPYVDPQSIVRARSLLLLPVLLPSGILAVWASAKHTAAPKAFALNVPISLGLSFPPGIRGACLLISCIPLPRCHLIKGPL